MNIEWSKVTWYSKVGAVIVVVIATFLSFYFWNEYQEIQTLERSIPVVASKDNKIPVDTKISEGETALYLLESKPGWLTYRGEGFEFEFQYPWSLGIGTLKRTSISPPFVYPFYFWKEEVEPSIGHVDGLNAYTDESFLFHIVPKPGGLTLEEWIKQKTPSSASMERLLVGGEEFLVSQDCFKGENYTPCWISAFMLLPNINQDILILSRAADRTHLD